MGAAFGHGVLKKSGKREKLKGEREDEDGGEAEAADGGGLIVDPGGIAFAFYGARGRPGEVCCALHGRRGAELDFEVADERVLWDEKAAVEGGPAAAEGGVVDF